MQAIKIPKYMERAFDLVERETGVPPEKQVRNALREYLQDMKDLRLARRALREAQEKGTTPLADVKKELGL